MDGVTYTYTNSIDNFLVCYASGFRYYEYDLSLSTDGKIIGTHDYEYLEEYAQDGIDYETFCNYLVLGKLQGVTIKSLCRLLDTRRDTYIVVDTKDQDCYALYEELVDELYEYGYEDLIGNFIPQVYSNALFHSMKDNLPFECYIYTNYKSCYSIDAIIDYFSEEEKIFAITLWNYYGADDISALKKQGFEVYLHTINDLDSIQEAFDKGATGVYTDNTTVYYK